MARPKRRTPIEPIATTAAARDLIGTINKMLGDVLRTAATGGEGLDAADRARVLTHLSTTLTYGGSGTRADEQVPSPFVADVAKVRYGSIITGILAGKSEERVAAEAGISRSAVAQILTRHSAELHPDPAAREVAKQRRRDAAHRAADRKAHAAEAASLGETTAASNNTYHALDADTWHHALDGTATAAKSDANVQADFEVTAE
jgi:hypothetical protein